MKWSELRSQALNHDVIAAQAADWKETYEAWVEFSGYDLSLQVSDDPNEIERHFEQLGDTPTERHYKRRMYEMLADSVSPFYCRLYHKDSVIFVFADDDIAGIVRINDVLGKPIIATSEAELESDLQSNVDEGMERARADAELRALALEMRRLHGTDELTFYFDLYLMWGGREIPVKARVFGGERKLEI